MYNPSRGGVRGGADQFTWESVKGDKHRENYLGHSLMAPVGRWQKGKDLAWYAKERKDGQSLETVERSELMSVKKAEEEAMLIALGHNIVRKTQTLTKEDMREALKRNTERDDHHFERIDGVGAASQRISLLSGVRKDARKNNEGVVFETIRDRTVNAANSTDERDESILEQRKKNKKKHKKEKKHKKLRKESRDSISSDDSPKHKMKYQKTDYDNASKKSSKIKHSKKSKHKHVDYSYDSLSCDDEKTSKLQKHKTSKSRNRGQIEYDSSDNEDKKSVKVKSHKNSKVRHQDYASDSDSPGNVVQHKMRYEKHQLDSSDKKNSKEKSHKKSKHKKRDCSSDDTSNTDFRKRGYKRHEKQNESVKRFRHDTSESD